MRIREESSLRSQVTFPVYDCSYWSYDSYGNKTNIVNYSTGGNTVHLEQFNRSMSDVVTKDFHKRRARGEIINSPMTQQITNLHQDQGYYHWTWLGVNKITGKPSYEGNTYRPYIASFDASIVDIPSINLESLTAQAVSSAHANCDLSETAILATLGEFSETVRGIVSILRRIYKIQRAVRKLDLKALRGELSPKELTDRYMEYRYGLRPLYYDALQLRDACTAAVKQKGSRQTFRGFATDSVSNSGSYSKQLYDDANWNRNLDVHYTIKRTVTARAGVLCQITDDSRSLAFGVRNIPQAMWELVPFSFIFDWFLNIGDVIASFSPKVGLNELTSWVVTEDVTSISAVNYLSGHNFSTSTSNVTVVGSYNAAYEQITTTKQRIVNPSRGILPRVDVNLDAFKLADLGIILNNLRK